MPTPLRCSVFGVLLALLSCVAAFGAADNHDVAYYTKLRMDFAARKDFSPGWEMEDERKAIIEAFKKSDYDHTISLADAWLKRTPVDAEAHLVVALAYKAKGELPQYCTHMGEFYGLLQSITDGADGHSAKTAFKVISVSEEYYVLRDIGAKVLRQSLVPPCDVMEVELRGKPMTFYFNVSISLAAMAHELGH